jgi:hypothetical protein
MTIFADEIRFNNGSIFKTEGLMAKELGDRWQLLSRYLDEFLDLADEERAG